VDQPVAAERTVAARTASLADTLDLAAELVAGVLAQAARGSSDVLAVVLGVPVPLEQESGRVADNNLLPDWVGHRPGDELAKRLGIDVVVENDANLGALGELRDEPPAARTLAYIKVGTGIGAGLVTDGRLFRGEGGTAGEIGHVQVDPAGVLCRCGSRGCLETVVSVPRLITALAPVTSEDLTPDGLGALVASGHPGAVRVVTDAGRTVGRVVASLVTVLNPGLVVLGGSVAPVNDLLADCIRVAVDEWATPAAASRVTVRASRRGDRGEVEGALALASEIARGAHQSALVG
jgi:predicted NBD/HSP70 family sugar kinase